MICSEVPGSKSGERVDLRNPSSKAEKIFLNRDNFYGADAGLFNFTFRDEAEKTFTLRFPPALISRRMV
jgi:hypothetical protein